MHPDYGRDLLSGLVGSLRKIEIAGNIMTEIKTDLNQF